MTRNFLFAPSADDIALTRFISTADTVSGFLKGAPGGPLPNWYQMGGNNVDFLQHMNAQLALSFPNAGQPFYAVRLWTNVMWQPAYLAVLGAHVVGSVPNMALLSQARQNNDINGYRLVPAPQFSGGLEEMIEHAGRQLRGLADVALAEINTVTKLKRVPALRLLADRMLSLMIRLGDYRPETNIAEQYRYCALWFEAMGLKGQGGLETLDLADGRQVVITARKGCCLDYLAFPDAYCASCPKQDDALRLKRQRDDAVAELDARD
ncbi:MULTISPECIES: siderophore ferric iron reductase [unclassified Devosia]|uniref:siderophore ferric iron reductase n=1 Tax=unclassified Devosia TaxID=196773 RepID=UPI00145CEEDF|nr:MULTISPECIES: siderophore ferric iron reductase [unclassified Devosia]MBJ6987209.1 siderophore ferric iron reductase [Devosia sp. MC521]QMW62823.1 siderophore ferric iron reductase [Devosia sp. MC521]